MEMVNPCKSWINYRIPLLGPLVRWGPLEQMGKPIRDVKEDYETNDKTRSYNLGSIEERFQ